jgi:hypothetical protein
LKALKIYFFHESTSRSLLVVIFLTLNVLF